MRLPSGELATTYEDNVKVFSVHFDKLLNYMKPADYSIINRIRLLDALIEFYLTLEW